MAGEVIWAAEALDDIDAIAAYIARDSLVLARRVVSAFFECSDLLLTQPRMGRMVPERQDENIREHFVYSYRLIYALAGEDIHVLAVIHGRRSLESLGERR
ncbi:type II toxin-antitoxin system mRNA interferase toxin, RelE/StbE family [Thiohalocapsa halophila]|uniref:Type II toxin-antitoxin system mRNA interferase toxin, RelE/StbE family n=1 Tax=Thiohalocapsa halophila TaxID=69359 RepID=A0ABS1CQR1_9GAMM|nr:type II toxin-antitoxin system RelE/ParE family toxin [Thiohalocapsa halophila]MBK1633701.1 type II toxin-antitoxin system mRNA interferase toxin, RelE/StbE family [Thiohalocapsa halophila]